VEPSTPERSPCLTVDPAVLANLDWQDCQDGRRVQVLLDDLLHDVGRARRRGGAFAFEHLQRTSSTAWLDSIVLADLPMPLADAANTCLVVKALSAFCILFVPAPTGAGVVAGRRCYHHVRVLGRVAKLGV
jgi:hypothetical protein